MLAKTGKTMETDGILTTAEIFGLPLNAELVVLSACQTGLGEISSDGVAGLSRAFLYAGASSLIVSLWIVADDVTQELMVKFYEELAADGNKARALQAAQLATMKKHPHPKDWAAFVLVGQPR
ncbi:MAG: CHAT domain-containing protein [bacterium]